MPVTLGATPTEVNFDSSALTPPSGEAFATYQAGASVPDPNNPEVLVRDLGVHFPNFGGVSARTSTTETIGQSSQGKLVTFTNGSATAVTLDSTVGAGFKCAFVNLGAGSLTLTPSSGSLSGLTNPVATNSGGWLFFDGTNWEAVVGGGGGGGAVSSVFGRTGAVVAVAGDYGVTTGGTGQTGSAKGDIVAGSGTNTNARLAVGTDGQVLTADSTQTTGLNWKSEPFDVLFSPNQVLGSGAVYDVAVFARSVTFAGNFSGSRGRARVNPGSTQTITVQKNGSTVGQFTISSSGVFTFTTTGGAAVTFAAGDYMTFTNQAGADASLTFHVVLAGTR